jgi:DNA-3-methyladenine glycosylase
MENGDPIIAHRVLLRAFTDTLSPKMAAARIRRLRRSDLPIDTVQLARYLIGKTLVHALPAGRLAGRIVETEAYVVGDAAGHAFIGQTRRNRSLFLERGRAYVYFIYGIHWMLNFSTAGEDFPEGILIRGILADPDGERNLLVGPGRVTKYLKIDKKLDGADVTDSKQIWLEDRGVRIPTRSIKRGPRIGVGFAGPYWAARPWRFWIERSTAALVTNH